MDVDLGRGITGTEASRKILKKHHLPIVFLTSHSEKEYVDKVKEITNYGYVLKNSGEFVLIESISMAFELFETNVLLRRENAERKRAEHALLKANANLQATLDALPDMLFEVDRSGVIHGFHSRTHDEPHADPKKFLGKRFQDILPESTVEIIEQGMHQVQESERRIGIEYPLVLDGKERWYQASIARKEEPGSGESRFLFLVRDISEQKQLERELEKSEAKYRMLYENAPIPYQSLDKDGRFLEVNPAWLETLGGYTREDVIGKSFADFIHPDSMEDFRRNLEEFKRKGKAESNFYKMRKRNGDFIDVVFQGCIAYAPDGEFLCTHCVFEDISSKRKFEESFHTFRREANVGIAEVGPENGFISVNPYLCSMLGYTEEELLACTVDDISYGPDLEWEKENLNILALQGLQDSFDYEKRYVHKNGSIVHSRLHSQVLRNGDGTIQSVLAIIVDITERKKQEMEARKREVFYRSLMENSIDAVYLLSEEGKVLDVNQSACDMLGYTREELLDLTIDDIDVNYPSKKFIDFWNTKPEGSTILFESTHIHKNGFTFPVEVNGIFFVHDGVKYLYGVARDVRKRKRAEAEIREKNELLHNITDNIFDLVALTDVYGNFTFVGKSHRILGYEPDELLGKNVLDFVHPDDLPRIQESLEDFIVHRKDGTRVEYRYRCADGAYIWLETAGKTLTGEDGNIKELLFSSRDISENKKFLISLQQSEEQLQRIMDSINDGIVVLDTDFKVVRTNRKLREDIGVEDETQLLGKRCYEAFHGFDEECA